MAFSVTLEAINADIVAAHYAEIARRAEQLKPAFEKIKKILEDAHSEHFDAMRGRYVLTGETRSSLTERDAFGAIREIHAGGMTFGTSIEQAHYLTKAPRDVDDGQVVRDAEGHLSAVLVLTWATSDDIARTLIHYLAEPW